MEPIEIIVIVACVLIVALVIIKSIIDKKKGKTSCGCDCINCNRCSSTCVKKKDSQLGEK